jgi:hypothetical protein
MQTTFRAQTSHLVARTKTRRWIYTRNSSIYTLPILWYSWEIVVTALSHSFSAIVKTSKSFRNYCGGGTPLASPPRILKLFESFGTSFGSFAGGFFSLRRRRPHLIFLVSPSMSLRLICAFTESLHLACEMQYGGFIRVSVVDSSYIN